MSVTERMIHVANGAYEDLPQMEIPNAFIGDAFTNPAGSEIACGFFAMQPGEALDYEYTYDEMKVIVEGAFTLTDLDTGQQVTVAPKDVLFFPKGIRVRFETTVPTLAFYTGHRSFAP